MIKVEIDDKRRDLTRALMAAERVLDDLVRDKLPIPRDYYNDRNNARNEIKHFNLVYPQGVE